MGIEVHILELLKYNLPEASIGSLSSIQQWAFFLLFADQYDAGELRGLLPAVEFDRAIAVIETISAKSEDRLMYDQREKAQRDYEWAMAGARAEGLAEGREAGREEGRIAGRIQLLQKLMGEPIASDSELAALNWNSLNSIFQGLQERLRQRDT